MLNRLKNFLGLEQGRSFGAPKPQPHAIEHNQSESLMAVQTRSIDLPVHIRQHQKQTDLPPIESIISGWDDPTTKKKTTALIKISYEYKDSICVVKTKDGNAGLLASTGLWGNPKTKAVFSDIRGQLQSGSNTMILNTYWCLPALTAELAHASFLGASVGYDSTDSKDKYVNEPNRKHFETILSAALAVGATDVHIEIKEEYGYVRFRIDSEMWPWENGKDGEINKEVALALIGFAFYFSLDSGSNSGGTWKENEPINWTITEVDFEKCYTVKLRLQSNPKLVTQGPDLIYRLLKFGKSATTYTMPGMGYSQDQKFEIEESLLTESGLFITAGVPNSGKTTATKTFLESVPDRERKKFVVAEDPSEFILDFASHATVQAGINDSERAAKYAEVTTSWLRGNPDILYLGEARDKASIAAAMEAAATGSMSFITIHASSILIIFDRLISPRMGVDLFDITTPGILKMLIYQKLMALLCQECSMSIDVAPTELSAPIRKIGDRLNVDVDQVRFRTIGNKDCPCCNGRGIKGMTLAAEVYAPSEKFLLCMRARDTAGAIREWESLSDGKIDSPNMQGKRILHHAFYKMLQGQVDPGTVRKFGRFETLLAPYHNVQQLKKVV
jgi:type II secretory ATPase GspE/PulE/Tfp pilus assembly ATPase PilB-like protein